MPCDQRQPWSPAAHVTRLAMRPKGNLGRLSPAPAEEARNQRRAHAANVFPRPCRRVPCRHVPAAFGHALCVWMHNARLDSVHESMSLHGIGHREFAFLDAFPDTLHRECRVTAVFSMLGGQSRKTIYVFSVFVFSLICLRTSRCQPICDESMPFLRFPALKVSQIQHALPESRKPEHQFVENPVPLKG